MSATSSAQVWLRTHAGRRAGRSGKRKDPAHGEMRDGMSTLCRDLHSRRRVRGVSTIVVAPSVPIAAARSTVAGVEIVAASVDERHSASAEWTCPGLRDTGFVC